MELWEKTIESKHIYDGKVLRLRVDTVEMPDGRQAVREVCDHPGAVAILAIDEENRVVMVRQYRYAIDTVLLEIPAGKLDHPGEDHREGAIRELKEETGLSADSVRYLGACYPSPGCLGEKVHFYLARGLHAGEQSLDEDEFLNVVRMPMDELIRRVREGEMADGKTMIAMMMAQQAEEADE